MSSQRLSTQDVGQKNTVEHVSKSSLIKSTNGRQRGSIPLVSKTSPIKSISGSQKEIVPLVSKTSLTKSVTGSQKESAPLVSKTSPIKSITGSQKGSAALVAKTSPIKSITGSQKGSASLVQKTSPNISMTGSPKGSSQLALQPQQRSTSRHTLEPIQEETIRSSSSLKVATKPDSLRISKESWKVCPSDSRQRTTCRSGGQDSARVSKAKSSNSSLLEKPFIFRNAASLQRAVAEDEKRILNLYLTRIRQEEGEAEAAATGRATVVTSVTSQSTETTDTKSRTDTSVGSGKMRLEYLMGLRMDGGEEEALTEQRSSESDLERLIVDESVEESITGTTEAMRQAQRYLRIHKIFEFYQFLIAHLLSALPDNPIAFLLEMLDKCIIYRAGMGEPPVLYEKKHIEALFHLMDRMGTGYISKDQYVTGMKTLGICSYKPNPPTSSDGMIHKSYFVEEAYENLVSMVNDLIRRRWIRMSTVHVPITTPPPTPQYSYASGRTKLSKE